MAIDIFTNNASTTVAASKSAVSGGTQESWTVASSTGFPSASTSATPPTMFRFVDPAAPSEIMACTNVSGTTWTVIRGWENTTPVTHSSGFTVSHIVSADWLGTVARYPNLGWMNVKDYGAVGDDSTDDTSRIQACIDAVSGTNILSLNNASFETDVSGWTALSNTTLASDATHNHAGSKAAKMTSTSSGSIGVYKSSTIDVCAGAQYTFSAWIWSPASTSGQLSIDWKDSSGTYISTSSGSSTSLTSSAFTQLSMTVTAPTLSTIRKATIIVNATATGSSQAFWLDDVSFGGIRSGTVYLPPSTYKITSALTVYSNSSLMGSGDGVAATTIHQTSNATHGISGTDVGHVRIENMHLSGTNVSGAADGIHFVRSAAANTPYITIRNVYITQFGQDGVSISNCIVSTLDKVNAENCLRYGFYFYGVVSGAAGTSVTFNSCYANTNTTTGFNLYNMVYTSLNSCASQGHPTNYLIDTCQSVHLNACGSESMAASGVGFKINGGYGTTLAACWDYLNKGNAFYLTGSTYNVNLISLVENSPDASATNSLKVDTGCVGINLHSIANTKPLSLASGTTNILNDGGNGLSLTNYVYTSSTGEFDGGLSTFGNFGMGATSYGGGSGVISLANAGTAPTSNPTGACVVYGKQGAPWSRDPNGVISPMISPAESSHDPTGCLASTFPRFHINSSSVTIGATSGTVYMAGLWLPAGLVITNINWLSGGTAASSPTHWWLGILDNTGKQLAHTADQTTGAIAANTLFTKALTSAYTTTRTGLFYISLSVTATTNPTATGVAAPTNADKLTPLLAVVSTSAAQTTPGTDGTTTYTVPTTGSAGIAYMFLT